MMITPIVTVGWDTIIRGISRVNILALEILALTPVQRWQAARRIDRSSAPGQWLTTVMVIVIVILVAAFLAATLRQLKQQREASEKLFTGNSRKRGLSARECQILRDMARVLKLKRSETLFTMAGAFARGSAEIVGQSLLASGAQQADNLKAELFLLREKLGFEERQVAVEGQTTKSLSTRQIPMGEKVYVTHHEARKTDGITGKVLRNDQQQLTVALNVTVESAPGELWQVRYSFGDSVWEFDTSTVSCDGKMLILNHSDDVRYVNRRRFLRVPVDREAFVACFPFMRTVPLGSLDKSEAPKGKGDRPKRLTLDDWRPLEFVPAIVTELAGPGLRIEASLEVSIGDRVLVMFILDREDVSDNGSQQQDESMVPRIVEDLGIVRHTRKVKDGVSIAVEFVGLSNIEVNELVRATNAALTEESQVAEPVA